MAYNTKYFSKVRDLDNKIFTINLKQNDYVGDITEIDLG